MTCAPSGIARSIAVTEIPYVRSADRLGGAWSIRGPRITTNHITAMNQIAAAMRRNSVAGTTPALNQMNARPATAPIADPIGLTITPAMLGDCAGIYMARPEGFEPPTFGSKVRCVTHPFEDVYQSLWRFGRLK